MSRRSQKSIQQNLEKQAAIQEATEHFFGGVTKEEAHEVFRTLAVLAQFPGAVPPEPLNGCEICWTSTLKVGDTLDKQIFSVTAIYRGLTFEYSANRNRVMQLPDGSFMNYENWNYQELLLINRCS